MAKYPSSGAFEKAKLSGENPKTKIRVWKVRKEIGEKVLRFLK